MTRTITAMFDSRQDAEAARDRLSASSIDASRVRIIDQGASMGASSSSGGGQHQEGFWASLKDMFMPDEDRRAYGEGIRRGGYMLAAEVEENQADEACRTLDQAKSVDFDQRQSEWRSQGWADYQATPQSGAFGRLSGQETGSTGMLGTAGATSMAHESDRVVDEEHIPVVEEELRVGKREVERGSVRVRSYVREIPVHESVNLHEEHVSVDRRPVNEGMRVGGMGDDDMFRDREVEMTEHAEEAVIGK